uniref:Uncharacterized protein n=1 Tax=Psilocybe cubensis TaxID=181762 RepID=A0A8H7Y753_PSICU
MDQYSEASFFVSQTKGATMSFSFYGTSLAVIGAKRGNHGPYHATIDGIASETFSGVSNPDQFNQTLFSSESPLGNHALAFLNDDNTFIDVDYVVFQSSIGEDGENLIVNTFQDTHPAFNYAPSSSWGTPSNVGTFSGGSGQSARDAIALYGPVGPASSGFSVKIDSGVPLSLNANKQFYRSQQILFFAANLGKGEHTLTLNLNSATSSGEFAIDYANVYTTPSLGGT